MSSNIDERVVSMKFNNGQFEQGIKETTKSLDSLKKGLNLEGAAKGLDSINVAASRFDLSKMADSLDAINSKFSVLGVIGATIISRLTNAALDLAGTLYKATVGQIVEGGAKRAMNIEQAKFQFRGLGLDVEKSMQSANDAVTGTAFGLDVAAKVAAQFGASGMQAGDEMTKALRGIAGVAAMTGTSFEDIGDIFTTIAGNGKLGAEELNRFSARGVNAAATLAKELGKTETQIRDMTSKGKIDFETFYTAMANAFGEHATKANETYTGSLSNLKAALSRVGAPVATTYFTNMRDIFNSLSPQIDTIRKGLKPLYDNLDATMNLIGDWGSNLIKGLKFDQLYKIAQPLGEVIFKLGVVAVNGLMMIGNAFKLAFPGGIEKIFSGITKGLNVLNNGLNIKPDAYERGAKAVGDFLRYVGQIGGPVLNVVINTIKVVLQLVGSLGKAFAQVFPPARAQDIKAVGDAIQKFADGIKLGADALGKFQRIFAGIFAVIDIFRMVVVEAVKMVAKLFGSTNELASGFLDGAAKVGDFLVKLRDAIRDGGVLTKVFDVLGRILKTPIVLLTALARVLNEVTRKFIDLAGKGVEAAAKKIEARLNPMKDLGKTLSDIWTGVAHVFSEVFKALAPIGDKIGKVLGDIGRKVGEALRRLDFKGAFDIINGSLLAGLTLALTNFFKGGFKDLDLLGAKGIKDSIKEVFGGLTDYLKAMQDQVKAKTLKDIAIAVALLAASAVALTLVDSKKLTVSLGAIATMMGELMGAMAIFGKITANPMAMKDIAGTIALLIGMAIALDLMTIAVVTLGKLKASEVVKGVTAVAVVLISMAGAVKLMSGVEGGLVRAGIGLILIAGAIDLLTIAVGKFSKMSVKELMKGLTAVVTLMGAMAGFTQLAKPQGLILMATGMVIMAVAINILYDAASKFSKMSVKELVKGIGAVGVIMAEIGGLSRLAANPISTIAAATAMLIIANAMQVMIPPIRDLSKMSVKELVKGLGGLAVVIGAIALALSLMPVSSIVSAGAIAIAAFAIGLLVPPLKEISKMSWEELTKGILMLAGGLLIISVALAAMSAPTTLIGAAAMIISATAITILAGAMKIFGSMSWDEIGRALTLLVSSLAIIAVVGLLAAPAMILLGAGMLLLGSGMMLAGTGMILFSAGLAAFAISGAAASGVAIAVVTGLINLIPLAIQKFGEGIVAFAQVIGNNIPTFLDAASKLIGAIIDAININAPKIIDLLFNLLMMMLQKIRDNIQNFVIVASDIMINFMNGLRQKLPDLTRTATDLIIAFMNSMDQQIPRIAEKGSDSIVKFINAAANQVRNDGPRMGKAGADLGAALVQGMIGGIGSFMAELGNKAWEMGQNAINSLKKSIDSHSPSKESAKLGNFFGWGFSNGIADNFNRVSNTASNLGNMAITSLKDTLTNIGSYVLDNMDVTPTITPILDLSEVEKNAGKLSGIIGTDNIDVSGSYNKATIIAAQNGSVSPQSSDTSKGDTPNVTFIQNNSSPKALSTGEVYRQTNNQLSQIKKKEFAPQ